MQVRGLWKLVGLLLMVMCTTACGGGGDEDLISLASEGLDATVPAIISELDDLPLATAPVLNELSSDGAAASLGKGARRGVTLAQFDGYSVDEGSSVGMCHATQTFQRVITAAGQADVLTCYIQNSVPDLAYDGSVQRFLISPSDDDEGDIYVEVAAERNGDALESLTMKSCEQGEQNQYLQYLVEHDQVSMLSKTADRHGSGEMTLETSLSGTVNDDGEFMSKMVNVRYDGLEHGSSRFGAASLIQASELGLVSGWERGTYHGDSNYDRAVSGAFELLDDSSLTRMAIGDGVAIGEEMGSDYNGDYRQYWSEGFLGDSTRAISYEGSHLADHESMMDVPNIGSAPTVSFVGDEVTRCNSDGAQRIEIDHAFLDAKCGGLSLDTQWFHCRDIIVNGGSPDAPEEGERTHAP